MPFTSLCANLKSESATTPRSFRDRFQRDGGLRTHEVTASPTNLRTPSLTPLTMAVRSAQIAPPAKTKRRECEITGMSATTGWVPGWCAKGRSGPRIWDYASGHRTGSTEAHTEELKTDRSLRTRRWHL
jgi:hypothetical protein